MLNRLRYPALFLIATAAAFVGGYLVGRKSAPDARTPNPSMAGPLSPDVGMFEPDPDALTLPDTIDDEWLTRARTGISELLHVPDRAVKNATEIDPPFQRPSVPASLSPRWLKWDLSDSQCLYGAHLEPPPGMSRKPGLIVVLHGHPWIAGHGMETVFDPEQYQHAIATRLAESGFRVLAIETRSFGHSVVGELSHRAYVQRLRLQRREFHGEVVADNRAVLDWATHGGGVPGAADEPVGVIGCSMGGLSAMFLSVVDERVDAVLVSGAGGSWRNSFSSLVHCPCSIVSGLLQRLDSIHILAATQARFLALEAGQLDTSLGAANLDSMLDELKSLGQRRQLDVTIQVPNLGHEHDVPTVISWFDAAMAKLAGN